MHIAVVGSVALFAGLLLSGRVIALPPLTSHSHTASNIQWESDGVEDGSGAHNHRTNMSFGGAGSANRSPYNANKCWDNTTFRLDNSGSFDAGHCFIDEGGSSTNVPGYNFSGTWPNQAKDRIRDAFLAWGSVVTDSTSLVAGVGFRESTSGVITVKWQDIDDADNGGFFDPNTKELAFDSSMSSVWNYDKSPSVIPGDKWHFYSVALHEIGHAVGLAHQSDSDDVMSPPVGKPLNDSGRHFGLIDGDSESGVRDLYSQPPGNPTLSNACTISLEYTGCPDPYSPGYSVSVADTSGAPGISMVDLDYQLGGWSSWSNLADGQLGCVGYSGTLGKLNKFRATILTSSGIGQCTYQISISSSQCDENPE